MEWDLETFNIEYKGGWPSFGTQETLIILLWLNPIQYSCKIIFNRDQKLKNNNQLSISNTLNSLLSEQNLSSLRGFVNVSAN